MIRSAREEVSAWASVLATIKSTPDRPETIMLLTALPPAPPTPHTMMRGFNSLNWGAFRFIGMICLSCSAPPTPILPLPRLKFGPSGRRFSKAPDSGPPASNRAELAQLTLRLPGPDSSEAPQVLALVVNNKFTGTITTAGAQSPASSDSASCFARTCDFKGDDGGWRNRRGDSSSTIWR